MQQPKHFKTALGLNTRRIGSFRRRVAYGLVRHTPYVQGPETWRWRVPEVRHQPHRPVSSPEDVVVRKTSAVALRSMREMVGVLYKGGRYHSDSECALAKKMITDVFARSVLLLLYLSQGRLQRVSLSNHSTPLHGASRR